MNTSGTKKVINLKNNLDLTKNVKVNPFSSFRDSNAVYFNKSLAPFYYKELENKSSPVYDKYGNRYEYYKGSLYKNDEFLFSTDNRGFNKEVLNPKSNCFLGDNSVVYNNHFLEFYYEEELRASIEYTLENVLTERLVKADLDYYYIALTPSNIVIWDIRKNKIQTFTSPSNCESPKIFFNYERYKTPLICIVNKSGSQIKSNELQTIVLVYTNNIWTIATLSQDVGTIKTTGTLEVNGSYSVNESKSLENKVCYRIDDKYYEDEEKTKEVFFDKGYTPILVENNIYKYTLYTTLYNYTVSFDQTAILASGSISIDVSINNPSYPVENHHPSTIIYPKSSTLEYTWALEYKSNNGYVMDKGFGIPEIVLECGEGATYYTSTININNITSNTDYSNRAGKTVVHNIPYEMSSIGATSLYTKYVLIDDGFFYGYNDAYSTINGTLNVNLINTVSGISGSQLTLTPSYKVWTASDLIPNGYLTSPYSLDINQYCFKWSTVFINNSTKDGRSLVFDSTCWNKTNHGCWLNAGVNLYTETLEGSYTNHLPNVTSNLQGSRYSENEFKLLYNDGYISGISYSEDKFECGILLTLWNSVDTEEYVDLKDESITFKQNNQWVKLSLVSNAEELRLIEKRYVVINTTDYYNAYDIKLKEKTHYATDWNNRTLGYKDGDCDNTLYCFVTGENINFSQGDSTLLSTIWPYHSYAYSGYLTYDNVYGNKANIELYYAKNSTPEYISTYKNGNKFFNSRYIINDTVLTYPTYSTSNFYINPDYFSDYIETGVNQDFIKSNNVAYKLYYLNMTEPVILMNTSSYINNMDTLFVLQSMAYGILDDKIYTLTFNNNIYTQSEAIVDVTGLIFCGNTPTTAYFYSPSNKSFYGFTGDCNMTLIEEASKISEVYKIWYNPSTQTIYLSTDVGLLLIGSNNTCLQKYFNVKDIFFSQDGRVFIIENDKTYEVLSDYKEGYESNKVILDTGLYGNGDNKIMTVDRWKIRLYNEAHLNGKLNILSYTLNDEGFIEKELSVLNINSKDWDDMFDTTLISYTPKNNRGVGVGIRIESDFAISELIASTILNDNTIKAKLNA